jgi:hypothetical protein
MQLCGYGSISKSHGSETLVSSFAYALFLIFSVIKVNWIVPIFFSFLLHSKFFQVAERIGREGKRLHFDVQVSAFDDFLVGE